jgi:hypothetical protein
VSEKVKSFWREKLEGLTLAVGVLSAADKATDALTEEEKASRAQFFEVGKKGWGKDLPDVLVKLSKEMTAPFALGE